MPNLENLKKQLSLALAKADEAWKAREKAEEEWHPLWREYQRIKMLVEREELRQDVLREMSSHGEIPTSDLTEKVQV